MKLTQIIFLVLLCFNSYNVVADTINQKNLSYASNKLEILPLLKLSSNKFKKNNFIFLHPPKVGGTNVVQVIDSIQSVKSRRFPVPRIKDQSPILITEGWIGGLASLKEQCKKLHNDCDQYKFLSGHFPYGVHKYLTKQYNYITLIRDPLSREISSVNFNYQRGYIKNKKQAIDHLFNIAIDNPQTRLLAGEEYMVGQCDEKTLEIAKLNLTKKFLLVGITEDTNTFIQALISILQLEPVALSRAQITGKKIIYKLPLKSQKQLLQKHKYDQDLYEYAKILWEEWKHTHIIGIVPIAESTKILTILPEFANTHKANYMTPLEIKKYNLSHKANTITSIKQMHHGVDKK